jgi:aspartyl-tRNA(Asn)/glutamyl-tRNA(Gln) amidotransferase subunit B
MQIQGQQERWEMIIGMEVHAQVVSEAKLFSGAATRFGAPPNQQVSLVDAAMPGMLPVLNEVCVRQTVKTGLGLNAAIHLHSAFDRKNYFYADLPQGYQISQLYHPLVGEGEILIDLRDGSMRRVGIERIHLEQDAGKSIHDQDPQRSLVDLNRTGVALMEIVSRPDLRSPQEAGAYLEKLRTILRYLGTCDGNMQEGSMRADVNVSVRPVGETGLRTRTETKNVNSIRFVQQVVEYEAQRQIACYDRGEAVVQETRLFDAKKGETRSMRSKENAHDYRYFPDPDLLPLQLSQHFVDAIRAELPELPDAKKARFMADFGLSAYDAALLVSERETANFFETLAEDRNAKAAANWMLGDFARLRNESGLPLSAVPVSAEALGGLIDAIETGVISKRTAKDVLNQMWESGQSAAAIIEAQGLKQVSDEGELSAVVAQIIAANPQQASQAKENPRLTGWFVGQVMKATGGQANPALVNKLLAEALK